MSDLRELEAQWLEAMQLRQDGQDARAEELFRRILAREPRLAEPRLELAHIEMARGHLGDAEEHARMAVGVLERGGQWIDDIEPNRLLAFACNLLGEVLRQRAEELALAEDRETFHKAWNGAADAFARAIALDPENREARSNATHVRHRDPN